jgi:hypothetical protein
MTRYVLVVQNNEGGAPATIHNSLAEAVNAARAFLTDPDNYPRPTPDELAQAERDLADALALPNAAHAIRGSEAWKEWLYIAPLAEGAT